MQLNATGIVWIAIITISTLIHVADALLASIEKLSLRRNKLWKVTMSLRRSLRIAGKSAPPAELPTSCRIAVAIGPEVLQTEKLQHYRNHSRYEMQFEWPETRAMQDEYVRLANVTERNIANTRARNVNADNRAFAQLSSLLGHLKPTTSLKEKCNGITHILTFVRMHPELLAAYPSFRKQTLQQLDMLTADLERAETGDHDEDTAAAIMNLQSLVPASISHIQSLLPRHPLYVTATY